MSRCAPAQVEMSSVFATVSPPAAAISSATAWAGLDDEPAPSRGPPRSLTTTLAPCAAKARACARPIPFPAPGMTTTRPVHVPAGICSPVWPGLMPSSLGVIGLEVGQERLVGEHAAVYADVLSGDEGGFVAGQEDHQRGDVLRTAEAGGERVPEHGRVHRLAAGLLADHDEAG